ncbi:hypothetical protein [Actinomycetospora straminea]|uniref:PE family protein n=1 Tax=Actinomycetospora straminea TaxID=663607 RepID=A0ABP9EQQ1_9PSEU|nr:hypothetical protein [Actinomycetospora straminea]MDD7933925.1 hypothetical protein [Actinomycetospora straminea]
MTEPQPPPLQADSPATLPDGSVVPRFRPPEVGGGAFTVDLARAPEAIRELEDAARELFRIRQDAEQLGKIDPPAQDQVSLDAARVLGLAANGGNGSLVAALDSGLDQIGALIGSLRTALAAYEAADDEGEASLRQP